MNNNTIKDELSQIPSSEISSESFQDSTPEEIPLINEDEVLREGIPLSNFDDTLESIVESDVKRYSSHTIIRLLASNIKDSNLRALRDADTIIKMNQRGDDLISNLITLKEENASLKSAARVKAALSPVLKISLSVGGILFSVGIDQLTGSNQELGWVLTILGGLLVLAVFYFDKSGDSK